MALDLGRVLEGELALDKVLGAHRAVDVTLGEAVGLNVGLDVELDVALDLVPDTDRVLRVAVVNMGGAVDLRIVLDLHNVLDLPIVLGVGMDVAQEVDVAAVMALDIGQNSWVERSFGVDVALHVTSGPGRRRPTRVLEHNSQSSV